MKYITVSAIITAIVFYLVGVKFPSIGNKLFSAVGM